MHIRLPEGFEQIGKDGLPRVARVRKALFGFKQSGRLWADSHAVVAYEGARVPISAAGNVF